MPSCDVVQVGPGSWRQATPGEKAACLAPAPAPLAVAPPGSAQAEARARAEAAVRVQELDRLALSERAQQAQGLWSYPQALRTVAPPFVQVQRELRLVNPPAGFDEPLREWQEAQEAKGLPSNRISHEAHQALRALPTRDQRAASSVAEAAELSNRALAQLPKADRERFAALASALTPDPMARLALDALLWRGAFAGGRVSRDGLGLLATLAKGLEGPALPGLSRSQMVADLVQELADPAAITQRQYGTCTATTLGILTARQWPAEYARVCLALADAGQVTLHGGVKLTRVPERPEGDPRSWSAALWSDALMELGNGPDRYDGKQAKSLPTEGQAYEGLDGGQVARLMFAVTGQASLHLTRRGGEGPEALLAQVRRTLTARQAVLVDLNWADSPRLGAGTKEDPLAREGHQVLVIGLEGDRVRVLNPHGREEVLSLATFSQRLIGVQSAA